MYADDNYQGATKVVTSDTSWIGSDWNDRVSSIKVERAKYRIVSRYSGLAVDVNGNSSTPGTNVCHFLPFIQK